MPITCALNGIPATLRHDEGAVSRCSYCGRYSLDPKTLSDRQPKCDCGEQHGWSGGFKKPGRDAKWSGAAPQTTEAPMTDAIDAKALATAQEIALMWGRDRSQFVSRIQVAVTEAMKWMYASAPEPATSATKEQP